MIQELLASLQQRDATTNRCGTVSMDCCVGCTGRAASVATPPNCCCSPRRQNRNQRRPRPRSRPLPPSVAAGPMAAVACPPICPARSASTSCLKSSGCARLVENYVATLVLIPASSWSTGRRRCSSSPISSTSTCVRVAAGAAPPRRRQRRRRSPPPCPLDQPAPEAAAAAAMEMPPASPAAEPAAVVVRAAKPALPIAKGLPGPGLLAPLIVSKYTDHLPLYRLERICERQGVFLHRSTLSGWMAACAELLGPLYERMVAVVLLSRALHTDDTHGEDARPVKSCSEHGAAVGL